MVLTLELPIRQISPQFAYEQRFGALPFWLDDIDPAEALSLLRFALRRGAPLAPADTLH